METNRKVLLETKCGFKLLNDRFIDNKGAEYLIKDMKSALMKEGNSVRADCLFITFKNGESKGFFFRSLPTPLWSRMKSAMIASFTMGQRAAMMTVTRELQIQLSEWAANINSLIDSDSAKP